MNFLKVEDFINDKEIKVISLNRPEVKNAFHPEMVAEITNLFNQFKDEKKIKAILIKGEGPVFCAGADLNWMKDMVNFDYEQNIKDSDKLWNMFDSITQNSIPLIGLVQGAAFGGALGLIACCDYVISDEKTNFCFSEVKLGLAPAVISSFVLRKTGDGYVRPLMLSAEVFSAEAAIRIGLVHQILRNFETWPDEIRKFSANGLEAMRETKKLLNQIEAGLTWPEQKRLTTKVISERRMGAEAQARIKNFIEKK